MAGIQGMLGVLCLLLFMTNCRSGLTLEVYCKDKPDGCGKHAECDASQGYVCKISNGGPCTTTEECANVTSGYVCDRLGQCKMSSGGPCTTTRDCANVTSGYVCNRLGQCSLPLEVYCKDKPDDCVKHAVCDASQGYVCKISSGGPCTTTRDCANVTSGYVCGRLGQCSRSTFCTVNKRFLSCHYPEDTGHPLSSFALYHRDAKTNALTLPVACVSTKGIPLCDVSGGFEATGTSLYNLIVKLPPETNGFFNCSTIPPDSFTTTSPCRVFTRDQHPVTSTTGKEQTEAAHINIIIICLSCAITVLVVIVVVLAVKSLRDSGCTRGRYWPCRTTDEDGTVLGNQT